jgi:four helix bundle protein
MAHKLKELQIWKRSKLFCSKVYKKNLRFLKIVLGSCYEIETQLLITINLKFILENDFEI